MMITIWKSRKTTLYLSVFFFLVMLVLNILTPYLVDDFVYHYSFFDGSRIENIPDIVVSMKAHAEYINGRLVAHGFMQLSTLFPKELFDAVNSFVFVMMLLLISKIGTTRQDHGTQNLLLIMAFCSSWLFVRHFGQVFLWQDGSINYLWGTVSVLLFLLPYVEKCIRKKSINNRFIQLTFVLGAYLAGAYTEGTSLAGILMAAALLFWSRVVQKQKKYGYLIAALLAACIGYLSIYLAPAQWSNKNNTMNFANLLHTFAYITTQYRNYTPLLVAFAVLLTLMFIEKVDINHIYLSVVFFFGSVVAMYIMTFAKFYVDRAALGSTIFLIIANAVAISALLEKESTQKAIICTASVLALLTLPAMIEGGEDIIQTYSQVKHNEQYIIACAEAGMTYVEVPCISEPLTQYSAASGLKYLDTTDPTSYPNNSMAVYYGVDTIIGK